MMLSFRRGRRRIIDVDGEHIKPRTLPENVFMWGSSFWDPWRDVASELAQQHLDHVVAQFKRSTHTEELRFHRTGNLLTISVGNRSQRLELIWDNGHVIEVINKSRPMTDVNGGIRTQHTFP